MGRTLKGQTGFAAIEGILIIIIVAIIGFTGYYVWHAKQNTDKNLAPNNSITPAIKKKTASSTSADATDPYAGWKTYTLKYEKASFKYPSEWQLSDSSFTSKSTQGGTDLIRINGTNGFQVSMYDGGPNDYGLPFGGATIVQSDKVTFLGQDNYLNLWQAGSDNTGQVTSVNLNTVATSVTSFPSDKNVDDSADVGSAGQNKFVITMAYYPDANTDGNSKAIQKPLSTVLADNNYAEAKLLVQSFSY